MVQDAERVYNHKHYEDYMFHFNTVTRTTCFDQPVVATGLDHCFDCASEVLILEQYLQKRRGMQADDPMLAEEVRKLVDVLSQQCSDKGRTLRMNNIDTHYLGFDTGQREDAEDKERRQARRSRFGPSVDDESNGGQEPPAKRDKQG